MWGEDHKIFDIQKYKYKVDYKLDRDGMLVVRIEVDKGISRVNQLIGDGYEDE